MKDEKVPFEQLGTVGGDAVRIDGEDWGPVSRWKRTYDSALNHIMQ